MTEKLLQQKVRIAVLLYVFHIDIYEEIVSLLSNIDRSNIDIFLAINKDIDFNTIQNINNRFSITIKDIIFVDNMGADILPFLYQISSLDHSTYSYFIKIHTKKSMWGIKYNVNWRCVLLNALIGKQEIINRNISILEHNNLIGMLVAKNLILRNREFTHSNKIKELCEILNIDYTKHKNKAFAAGSMFMTRSEPFVKCFTKEKVDIIKGLMLSNNEIGPIKDIGRNDGTYSHSIERIFGYLMRHNNIIIKGIRLAEYRILNKIAEKGYFNLVLCYDNTCYLEEDLNCYGNFFDVNKDSCVIEWKHMPNTGSVFQRYNKLDSKTFIKAE